MAGVMAVPVGAQEGSSLMLEEVVVTAQKRTQSLQDVPIAVQAIDGDSLKQSGVASLSDITSISPGLKIANMQGSITTTAIRGVSSFAFGFGVEESVPFYLDGIYLGNGAAMLGDLIDIQQVEVLKGPQGTLFGRNASGGAINVRTKRPTDELEGFITAGGGNYDLYTTKGVGNLPLFDDRLLVRTGFSTRNRDGWQTNVVTGDEDGYKQDRWSGFVKALWLVNDELELEYYGDRTKQRDHVGYRGVNGIRDSAFWQSIIGQADSASIYDGSKDYASGTDGFVAFLAPGFSLPVAPADPVPLQQNRDIYGNALTIRWDINDNLALTSLTSYRKVDTSQGTDSDGTNLGLSHALRTGTTKEFNQEVRLNMTGEQVDWFVGVNYYQQKRDETLDLSTSGLVPLSRLGISQIGTTLHEESGGDNKTESYALFGDAIWHVTDAVNVTAGLRYSYDEKNWDMTTTDNDTFAGFGGQGILFPNVSQMEDPTTASQNNDWDNLSGRLVVDYQFNDDLMAYASVSTGYKSGGYNTTRTVIGSPETGFFTPASATEPFKEETNTNFELGVKSSLMDGRMRLNSSIFVYRYEDLQFLLGDSEVPVARTINADQVDGTGWDADITFLATENLTLFANFTVMDVQYGSDVVDRAGELKIQKNEDRPWSPAFSGIVGLDHEMAVGSLGTLRTNLSYSYTDDHLQRDNRVDEDIAHDTNRQESYGLLSSRISLYSANEKWEIAAWGKNLLDEDYRNIINGSVQSTAGINFMEPGEPRTYGIDVQYNF
jgi:iron complex outermembrane receptor protein